MNKQEIIEWFIKKVSESKVLEGIITKDEMREKLNNNINEVIINDENHNGYYTAEYNDKVIYMGTKVKNDKFDSVLIHEMLHALSAEFYENGNRDGFARSEFNGTITSTGKLLLASLGNHGINEGMTEYLASKIYGKKSDTYYGEQRVVKLLELFVGRNNLVEDYLNGTEKSKEIIDLKYGEGTFEKISTLRDMITRENNRIYDLQNLIKKFENEESEVLEFKELINEASEQNDERIDEINNVFINMANTELTNCVDLKEKLQFLTKFIDLGKNITGNSININQLSRNVLEKIREEVSNLSKEEMEIYKDIIAQINTPSIEQLIEKYQNGELEARGEGNSSICFIINDDNVLLVSDGEQRRYNEAIQEQQQLESKVSNLKNKRVNIQATRNIALKDGKLFTLQERAKGITLYRKSESRQSERYKNDINEFSKEEQLELFRKDIIDSHNLILNVPREQVEKYISDYLYMVDEGISWDTTPENLLYDNQQGFSFVDINNGTWYTREEIQNNQYQIYGLILQPLIGAVESLTNSKLSNEELLQSTKRVFEKIIPIMNHISKNNKDIFFSKEILGKTINLINSKFGINLDKNSLLGDRDSQIKDAMEQSGIEATAEETKIEQPLISDKSARVIANDNEIATNKENAIKIVSDLEQSQEMQKDTSEVSLNDE